MSVNLTGTLKCPPNGDGDGGTGGTDENDAMVASQAKKSNASKHGDNNTVAVNTVNNLDFDNTGDQGNDESSFQDVQKNCKLCLKEWNSTKFPGFSAPYVQNSSV